MLIIACVGGWVLQPRVERLLRDVGSVALPKPKWSPRAAAGFGDHSES